MKTNKNSIIASVCLLCIAVAALASCGDSGSEPVQTSAPTGETTAAVTEPIRLYNDSLPADLETEGKTLRSMTNSYDGDMRHARITAEEDGQGELINDAIYTTNLALAERFGITFEETCVTDATVEARRIVNAGDNVYDLITTIDRDAYTLASEGMMIALDSLKHVDLSQPWWNGTLNEALTVGGRLWAGYSDAMLTSYDYTHIILFNKDIISAFDLDNPYDLVADGTWTFEKFAEMAEEVTSDINGDNVYDENDRYGWLSIAKHISPSFWVAAGVQTITKDENDIPVYTMGENQRMLDVLQLAYDMSWGDSYWYHVKELHGASVKEPPIFANGNALFTSTTFYTLFDSYYREIEFDYGIIPYPKYDEAQETYYSRVEGGNLCFVPVTCADPDFAGAMMEALACEFKNTVLPAYYEMGLKVKYSRDEQSGQVLDLVMSNRIYDLGDTIYNADIRDGFVFNAMTTGKAVTASNIEKSVKKVSKRIEKMVEKLTEE